MQLAAKPMLVAVLILLPGIAALAF